MRLRRSIHGIVLATATLATTAIAGSAAAAAGWTTVAQHRDSGRDAETQVSADVHHPKALRIRVQAKKAPALVYWTETCGHKGGSKVKNGKFHVAKSHTKATRLPQIFADDLECLVQTQGSLKGSGTIVIGVQKLT